MPVRRLLFLVAAVVFADTVFYSAITPLLPRFSADYGLTKAGAGILAAAYPAGTFFGSLPGGLMAARAGVRPTVLLGLGLMGVSSVVFAFAQEAWLLDAARFVQGIGGAASWSGAIGWLVGAAPRERRGELIGSALGAAIAGTLFGPVLGALADALSPEAVFSSVAVVAAGLAIAAMRVPPAEAEGGSLGSLVGAARDARVASAMWLVALPGLLFGTIGVLAPLRLDALGAGSAVIAGAFLAAGALEAVVSPVAGRVADRRGRFVPALFGVTGSAVLIALFPWPAAIGLLVGLIVITAPTIGTLWAPAMALLSDGAERRGIPQGLAFALVNLAWSTGQTAGAAGSSRLADATADSVPYLALAGICVVSVAVLRRAAR